MLSSTTTLVLLESILNKSLIRLTGLIDCDEEVLEDGSVVVVVVVASDSAKQLSKLSSIS